jgi:glycosyltransferase involved in cell wall biosynthesis
MKKKVLQIIDGLNVGGAEMLLIDLVRGLRNADYDVVVAYSTPGPLESRLRELDIPLFHLPRKFRVDPMLFLGIWKLIKKEKPDIVHTHLFKSDLHGRIAAWLSKVPLIISTVHNNDAWIRKFPLGQIYGWTARLAHLIIAVSEEVREYHIQYANTPADKIQVISNGVDISRFANPDLDPKKFRAELGIESSAPVLGIIGRLQPQKDHENFLNAAVLIANEFPSARFVIIGDGPLRDALIEKTKELNLSGNVIFTGIRHDIPLALAALDVMVISSRWEGLPVTLLEALAARRVVVATNVGGIADVVTSGESAMLVPAEDHMALAESCMRVLRDPQLAFALANAGFERVNSTFSMDAMMRKTVTLYQSLWDEYAAH